MVPRRLSLRGSRQGDKRSRGGPGVPTEAGSRRGEDEDKEEVDGNDIVDPSEEGEDKGGLSTVADARWEEEEDQEECG